MFPSLGSFYPCNLKIIVAMLDLSETVQGCQGSSERHCYVNLLEGYGFGELVYHILCQRFHLGCDPVRPE